jgi:RHS repeat-associated protein
MQQLPMKLKRICWITSVIAVIASAASAHLLASDLEQQILAAIARGEDISELVASLPDARKSMSADSPPSELSVAAAELDRALANLAQTLGQPRAKGDEASDSLEAAGAELQAAHEQVLEHFRSVETRLQKLGIAGEISGRLAVAEQAYLGSVTPVLDAITGDQKSAADRETLLQSVESLQQRPAPPVLRNLLPYRQTSLVPRMPVTEPVIVPCYQDPAALSAEAADMAATDEAPFHPEIVGLAQELGYSAIRIREHVRNQITTEWYAGSQKGALGTLRQGSGNHVDQASLLIALLRASRVGARYVHGVVEMPLELVAADLGLRDPSQVPNALTRAGLANRPVVRGGSVAAVEVEYTWVAAFVPYSNYRGAVVDISGEIWLPFAPAIKSYDEVLPAGILGQMGLSVDSFITETLATAQPADPLSRLRAEVESYLLQTDPDAEYQDQLGAHTIIAESLGLLPSSLPVGMKVIAVTGEAAELDPALQNNVRLVVRADASPSSPALLDSTVPLSEVAGHRLTVSYMPATVDDHTIVNAFGGLSGVPLYLVQIRPQIKLDGRALLVGEEAMQPGVPHLVEIEVSGPAGTWSTSHVVTSGSYHAVGIGARVPIQIPEEDDPADTEPQAAPLLAGIALAYDEQWTAAEDELAGLLDVSVVRPVPSVAAVAEVVEVDYLGNLPLTLRFTGVTLDAAQRVAEPLARGDSPEAARDWMRLSALQGSALEHQIFEQQYLVEAISADKGLGLARDNGIEVVLIQDEADPDLIRLDHPQEIEDEIRAWLRLGMTVEAPLTPISHVAWTGSVWRIEDPDSGAAGYLISGALAGGTPVDPPDSWLLDFLRDALESPYAPEPNPDPMAATQITKLRYTDEQDGTVDEVLIRPLTVEVRDGLGRPVVGADVIFYISQQGDGAPTMVDAEGNEASTVTVTSDRLGRASAKLHLGLYTTIRPAYAFKEPGDRYPQKVLEHQVDAWVTSSIGTLVIDEPFTAWAFPDTPVTLRRTDTTETVFKGMPGTWVDTIQVTAEDQHQNPVSNVEVTFAFGDMVTNTACENQSGAAGNGAVFDNSVSGGLLTECGFIGAPLLGECGGPSLSRHTTPNGTGAGVIMGDSFSFAYQLEVSATSLPSLQLAYIPLGFVSDGQCLPVNDVVYHAAGTVVDGDGNNINAARVGWTYDNPVQITLLYWWPEIEVRRQANEGDYYLYQMAGGEWKRTTGNPEFTVSNGGSAQPSPSDEEGVYPAWIRTGIDPGLNQVSFSASEVTVKRQYVDPETGATWVETEYEALSGPVTDVFGLDLQVSGFNPDPVRLTFDGRTEGLSLVNLSIAPEEYIAAMATVDLYVENYKETTWVSNTRSGQGLVVIPRGYLFDFSKTYWAELVLNPGYIAEVRSERVRVPLSQGIIISYGTEGTRYNPDSPPIMLRQDIDVHNQSVCGTGADFFFNLSREAEVSLVARRVEDLDAGYDVPLPIIDPEVLPAGEHRHMIAPSDLTPGKYVLELKAIGTADGLAESRQATAISEVVTHNNLPISHAMYEDIDLWDGHLTVSRQDLAVPGRGIPLRFSRTYSSSASGAPGLLGVGWIHSYQAGLTITRCGEIVLNGGDGSGTRFVDDGNGGLKPEKGHHGTLIANADDSSFDFYSKSGNRFHYLHLREREWYLSFIEDPSGNRTVLSYTGDPETWRVSSVVDATGQMLRFGYEQRAFVFRDAPGGTWTGWVLVRVDGPGGMAVTFDFDDYGNLIQAARESLQAETYTYRLPPQYPFDEQHLISTITNELTGGVTTYEYLRSMISTGDGGVIYASHFVSSLTRPEGGVVSFTYDLEGLANRTSAQISTTVNDARGFDTVYTMNQYGSPVSILDANDGLTTMEWPIDDIVLTARTDASGARTEYLYDEHGNQTHETVTITDVDGDSHTYSTETTYWPANTEPPYIKSLVKSYTNRNGDLTELFYDTRGLLTEQRTTVSDIDSGSTQVVVSHSYDDLGGRRMINDGNGNVTYYDYDAHGNLAVVTDPLGGQIKTEYDERGMPSRVTDVLGNVAETEYDDIGRITKTVLPRVSGEPAAPEETTTYLDAEHRTLLTDAQGRVTEEIYDLEGRIVRMVDAEGAIKVFEYDLEGNKTIESGWFLNPGERVDTTFIYDDCGHLIRREEPEGRITEYDYDSVGRVIEERLLSPADPSFVIRVVKYDHDGLGRLIRTTFLAESDREITEELKHDGMGKVVLERDPLGRETIRVYDELGRLIERSGPDWRTGYPTVVQFVYDANGNRIEERLQNQRRTADGTFEDYNNIRRFTYDSLNRMTTLEDAEGGVTSLRYDTFGNLIREIDPRLNVTDHTYDERNRLTSTTTPLDHVTDPARSIVTYFEHDTVGNLVLQRLPNGNVARHTYDGLNRPTGTTDTLGQVVSYEYDAAGNLVREVDANDNETISHFDDLNRLVQQDLPEARHTFFEYDAAGNKTLVRDPRGNETKLEYDRLDRLIKKTDPPIGSDTEGFTTEYTYDDAGNKLTETNPRGYTTTFAYDDLNRLTTVTTPELSATSQSYTIEITYDAAGNRLTEKDRREILTEHFYDCEHRPIRSVRAGLTISEAGYDAAGNVIWSRDANGSTTSYEYDERNLLITVSQPLSAITRLTLDDMGDVISARDPEGRVSSRTYDVRQRVITETNGEGETTTYEYDGNANLTARVMPKSAGDTSRFRWEYTYDDADRLTTVDDPLESSPTIFQYDLGSKLRFITDAESRQTELRYDELGRMYSKILVDGSSINLEYDANGNLTKVTDPKAQVITSVYDELDRLDLQTFSAPADAVGEVLQSIDYEYDANDNLVNASETYGNGVRTYTRQYDDFDRVWEVVDGFGNTLRYGYDANGNRTSLLDLASDPAGLTTSYIYDALNRLVTVNLPGLIPATYSYDRSSLPQQVDYPNGTRSIYTFDNARRLTLIETTLGGTSPISQYEYTYDANGNRATQVETNGGAAETTTYTYDDADRMVQVDYPGRSTTYVLDAVGNRMSETSVSGPDTLVSRIFSYDNRHRLMGITDQLDPARSVSYGYDVNGNQTSRSQGGATTLFRYDSRDQLLEVEQDSSTIGTFSYDFQGLRVVKHGADGLLRYVYDGSSVLLQTSAIGDLVARYDYGPDRLLAVNHFTEGRSFYHFDALDSITNLTDNGGSIQARYQYDAWGNYRSSVGDRWNPFGFTGHEYDKETNLYYARARFYDPEVGRFLTQDPFDGSLTTPPSLHKYLYAYGNPTVYWDPDGEQSISKQLDDQLEWDAEHGCWFSFGLTAAARVVWTGVDVITFGFISRHDAAFDAWVTHMVYRLLTLIQQRRLTQVLPTTTASQLPETPSGVVSPVGRICCFKGFGLILLRGLAMRGLGGMTLGMRVG